MITKTQLGSPIVENQKVSDNEKAQKDAVIRFKKRMLEWPNPVEFVNNMYGCHPDDDDNEYFKEIFAQ